MDYHDVEIDAHLAYKRCPEWGGIYREACTGDELLRWHWSWASFKKMLVEANYLAPIDDRSEERVVYIGSASSHIVASVLAGNVRDLLKEVRIIKTSYPGKRIIALVPDVLVLDEEQKKGLDLAIVPFDELWANNWVIGIHQETTEKPKIIVDTKRLEVTIDNYTIQFKPSEQRLFHVFQILAASNGNIVDEDQFSEQYSGIFLSSNGGGSQFRTYITELRRSLGSALKEYKDHEPKVLIETVRGRGYRISHLYLPCKIQ